MLERFSLIELLGFYKEVPNHCQRDRQVIVHVLVLHFTKYIEIKEQKIKN